MPALLNWGESEQKAFETLQRLVCEAHVMAIPVPGKPSVDGLPSCLLMRLMSMAMLAMNAKTHMNIRNAGIND